MGTVVEGEVVVRAARPEDLPAITDLLKAADLPI